MRILLVEDDAMIGKTLQKALQQDGYAVDWAVDGQAGRLALDTAGRTVTHDGRTVELSAREFALLAALLERPGASLSKAQLEERVYRWGEELESNAVEVHIHHLRKKLGPDAIRTIRGVGYA